EMIERRELARGQRRRYETRPMRQHQSELIRHERSVRCDDESVRGIGEISDKYAIEVRPFMSLRKIAHIVDVDRGPARRINLRVVLRPDHPAEINAHRLLLVSFTSGRQLWAHLCEG